MRGRARCDRSRRGLSAAHRAGVTRSGRRLRVTWLAAAVLLLALVVTACEDDDEGPADTSATADDAVDAHDDELEGTDEPEEAAGFCAALEEHAGAVEERVTDDDPDDPFEALFDVLALMGDVELAMAELADEAPDEIAGDMEAVAEAMATDVEGVADDPASALVAALVTGAMAQGAVERVDAYAEQHCGQPVVGGVAFRAAEETTPRERDDGSVVVDVTNVYGEDLCDDGTDQAPDPAVFVDDDVAAFVCGQPEHLGLGNFIHGWWAFGLDLEELEVVWRIDLTDYLEEPDDRVDAATWRGGVGTLAVALREDVEPEGLDVPGRRSQVVAWDIATGEELFTEEQGPLTEAELDDGQEHLDVRFVDDEGRVAVASTSEHELAGSVEHGGGMALLRILEREGEVWRTVDLHPTLAGGPAGDLYLGRTVDDGGEAVPELRRYSDDEPLHEGEPLNLTHDSDTVWEEGSSFVQLGRSRLGEPFEVLDIDSGERFELPRRVAVFTHAGVLAPVEDGTGAIDHGFFDADGEVFELDGDTITGRFRYVDERLFVESAAEQWVEVDLATGEDDPGVEPPQPERQAWKTVEVDGVTRELLPPSTHD